MTVEKLRLTSVLANAIVSAVFIGLLRPISITFCVLIAAREEIIRTIDPLLSRLNCLHNPCQTQGNFMSTKADEILKKIEGDKSEEEREHSLQENAINRSKQPLNINAGTAFDWEDMEAYAKELERMDKDQPYKNK
jgi:hypothetical protein